MNSIEISKIEKTFIIRYLILKYETKDCTKEIKRKKNYILQEEERVFIHIFYEESFKFSEVHRCEFMKLRWKIKYWYAPYLMTNISQVIAKVKIAQYKLKILIMFSLD